MKNLSEKHILITGGSSGIGLAVAKLLAQEGAHIWLLARREDLLRQALAELEGFRSMPTQRFGMLTADVAQFSQVQRAVEHLQREAVFLNVVIHSAGVVQPGYFEDLELGAIRQMVDINLMGSIHVAKAVLPGMIAHGSGALVFVSSMAGVINLPGYTGYGATKFAVRGFCDALRAEVKHKGIDITVVLPPDTDTPQHAYELPIRPRETSIISGLDPAMPPEIVARYIIRGIKRKQYLVIPGLSNQFFCWLFSALGPLAYPMMDLVLAWAIRKAQNTPASSATLSKKGR